MNRGACLGAVVVVSIAFSWLAMQVVHEAGHVLHAWLSGGSVARVVLEPLEISRTELRVNPRPLVVAWGGVVWGVALPAALALATRGRGEQVRHLGRFFAGFCLVANGAYLVAGTLARTGDPADVVRLGAPAALVLLVGAALAAAGLWQWQRLGPRAGFSVHSAAACPTAGILAALLAVLLWAEIR